MSRRYDNSDYQFMGQAVLQGFGLFKHETEQPCVICKIPTKFFALDTQHFVCCEDCRVLDWQRGQRDKFSGTFKTYTLVLKNGTKKEFGKVRAWFGSHAETASYLYIEQLDTDPNLKSRWGGEDFSDIIPGERVEDAGDN